MNTETRTDYGLNKYYKTLELDKVLDMLSALASNERTRQLIGELRPETDIDIVRREIRKTSDAFDLTVRNGNPGFSDFHDIRTSLDRAASGASLSLGELMEVARLMRQSADLSNWYRNCEGAEDKNSLDYLFSTLSPDEALERKISDSIVSEDEVSDLASFELADIRRKIARAGVQIRESLDKLVKSSEVQKSLQENIITMRDGRYVLPVKSENKGKVRGIVHAASATGSTLFVEPESVVEANNDIRILKEREKAEIERIIAELSQRVGAQAENISRDFETCAELDVYFAKAALASKMRACEPIVSDDGVVVLKKARHPLIDEKKVVPVDIALGESYDSLIITGPNTGGKTVLLKTTGLMCAMTMCGLLIPVGDGSKVSVFENILADIGDMQSIENDLSTFSAHISNTVDIFGIANSRSLILLDELGSGTDPVEGAALAVSIIKALRRTGARLMVTTHYQELKIFAVEENGVENGSCEFDADELKPTYKLIIGAPGKSNAFYISSRLGLPSDVIEDAKELVSDENRHFEDVVRMLDESRCEYERLGEELRKIKEENEVIKAQLERDKQKFEDSKDIEFERARIKAMAIVENCQMESDKLLSELKQIRKDSKNGDNSASAKSISRSAIDKMYKEANPVRPVERKEYKLPRPLKRGDNVLIVDIDKKGILASDPDSNGNVFVQQGIMKTRTNIKNLQLIEIDKKQQTKPTGKVSTKGVKSNSQRRPSLELDIRGHAVDDGILEVDTFIDNAVMGHAGIVTIIHGKGTGVLRNGIQRHLKGHPSVKSFRNGVFGEGEDGVTIVELK